VLHGIRREVHVQPQAVVGRRVMLGKVRERVAELRVRTNAVGGRRIASVRGAGDAQPQQLFDDFPDR
jgi:hypothetical protein